MYRLAWSCIEPGPPEPGSPGSSRFPLLPRGARGPFLPGHRSVCFAGSPTRQTRTTRTPVRKGGPQRLKGPNLRPVNWRFTPHMIEVSLTSPGPPVPTILRATMWHVESWGQEVRGRSGRPRVCEVWTSMCGVPVHIYLCIYAPQMDVYTS